MKLPIAEIDGVEYYYDARLKEFREVDNPHSRLAADSVVLIEVQGGVAQLTSCPAGVRVAIVDYDNESDDE
jgi:hypothetical protein